MKALPRLATLLSRVIVGSRMAATQDRCQIVSPVQTAPLTIGEDRPRESSVSTLGIRNDPPSQYGTIVDKTADAGQNVCIKGPLLGLAA